MFATRLDLSRPLVWTVPHLLTQEECAAWIERIDAAGPRLAPITTARGPVEDTRTRNNERVMFDDWSAAEELFERVRRHVPLSLMGQIAVGLNERFRGYRYGPGQRFAPHYDGAFVRNRHERSQLTLLVYLNDGFEGGQTAFLDLRQTVEPRTGLALLFQHQLLHEGCVVRSGRKYVLRTDVMYRSPSERPDQR